MAKHLLISSIKAPKSGSKTGLIILAALFFVFAGYSASCAAAKTRAAVSILPQQWFVEQIGGDLVEVSVLVGPGHSPATYEPTPKQMALLQGADLFFSAGVPFENGLITKIANLSKQPKIIGPRPQTHNHDHHGHGHHHGEMDPHSWLAPSNARALADSICVGLTLISPENGEIFNARRTRIKQELTALETEVAKILEPYAGHSFFVFHPAFGHFAKSFALHQIAVEVDGHEPGIKQLAMVIEKAKASKATAIITQPQFSRKTAKSVADAINAEVVLLDPLAYDYPANLLEIANSLANIFQKSGSGK